ncbi:MAG: zinc-ribbon domain-containing protein [Clostridiales bacterium]|nr:zinc-ribbon domain-containing protein [Clostridiales bacterium]
MALVFCPECGAKNDGRVRFCSSCGAELIDNQDFPDAPRKASQRAKKGAKNVSFLSLSLIVGFFIISIVGTMALSPENLVKEYSEALSENDWEKAYSFLQVDESEFINEKAYAKAMEEKLGGHEIVNFEITGSQSQSPGALIETFRVKYAELGGAAEKTATVSLVKNRRKRYLFFDDYSVSAADMTVSGFKVSALEGSKVLLDNVELSLYDDGLFHAPDLFKGAHEVKVSHPEAEEMAKTIDMQKAQTLKVLSMGLSEGTKASLAEMTRNIYSKLCEAAAQGIEFQSLGLPFASEKTQMDEMKQTFEDFANRFTRGEGEGFLEINVVGSRDGSAQLELDESGTYLCELEIEYDYSEAVKDRQTGMLVTRKSSKPSSYYIRVLYKYEGGKWVLFNLNRL